MTCPGHGNYLIADPVNCLYYYECQNGELANWFECSKEGHVFNPAVGACDEEGNVPECRGGTRDPGAQTPAMPSFTITSPTPTPTYPERTTLQVTVTPAPAFNMTCDFKEILVHPYPLPCKVEFICHNFETPFVVNDCGFIDFGSSLVRVVL